MITPVFLENTLLFVIFNYSENWFLRTEKLTHVLQFCRKIDSGSDTIVPTASAHVATPTMAQAPMLSTIVPISVSPREKLKKFSGLNFKRCCST